MTWRLPVALLICSLVTAVSPATALDSARLLPYPPGARTGVAEVDWFLDAMQQKDAGAVARRIKLVLRPCDVGPYGPACRDGETPGPRVRAFQTFPNCEASWLREDSAEEVAERFVTGSVRRLFAVAAVSAHRPQLAPRYSVLFVLPSRPHPLTSSVWLDGQGRVAVIHFVQCAARPCEALGYESTAEGPLLLPPRSPCPA